MNEKGRAVVTYQQQKERAGCSDMAASEWWFKDVIFQNRMEMVIFKFEHKIERCWRDIGVL